MTLDDVHRRQMIYAPTMLGFSLLAGGGMAFVWLGSIFPWWSRGLAVLLVLLLLFIAIQAYRQLLVALKEQRHLKRFAKANRRGPQADPLQTPNARRDDADGMGGFDIFGAR